MKSHNRLDTIKVRLCQNSENNIVKECRLSCNKLPDNLHHFDRKQRHTLSHCEQLSSDSHNVVSVFGDLVA
eukprot:756201-Hanusia_phi.AAC.1